jgi:AcrR family transcriptional regulator
MDDVPQDVRDSMVIEAWMLIAERGLEGMSTREVLARTGAPRGSVYHYFPGGRTQLIEQAIDRAQSWMSEQIAAIEAQTPAEVVRGYVDIWRRVLETTDYRAGCAIVGLISGAQEPGLLARGATAFAVAADGLAARFRQVGASASDANNRGTLVVAAVEGAVLMSRAQHNVSPLELVAEQLQQFPV